MTFVGCRVNLKIKLSNFTENYQVHFHRRFIKPPGRVKCGVGTIVKLCSEIGLNIVESTCSASSSRVCQSCGRKIFNTAELVQFIYSDQERNVEVPICSSDCKIRKWGSNVFFWCPCLCWTGVLKWERIYSRAVLPLRNHWISENRLLQMQRTKKTCVWMSTRKQSHLASTTMLQQCCNNTGFDGSRHYFYFHKQNKANCSLGNIWGIM